MEKVEDAPFSPADRIGQLTMRNLDTWTRAPSSASMHRAGLLSLGGNAALAQLGDDSDRK